MPWGRKRKTFGDQRLFKAYTPFMPAELEQIDEWGFARRIRERSETIRRLVMQALSAKGTARGE